MKTLNTAAALALVWMASIAPARALAIYNSFGPGNTYQTTVGWGVEGASTSGGYRGRQSRMVRPEHVAGTLNSIELATFHFSGSGRANWFLTTDNGGVPGTVIESYLNVLSPNGLMTLTSSSHSELQAGQVYWLCAEPVDSTSGVGWYENSQNVNNSFAFERSQSGWQNVSPPSPPNGVFSVDITPVPEPSTASITFIAIGALVWQRNRIVRRQNV